MGLQTIAGASIATTLLGAGTIVSANTMTVQQGDTLSEIAQKHHTTVADLVKDNGIKNADLIFTGQTLNYTDKSEKSTSHKVTRKDSDTDYHYTVVAGDTLSTIAEAYDTTPDKIAQLNGMSTSDVLSVGSVLTVAGEKVAPSQPVVADTPTIDTTSETNAETNQDGAVAKPVVAEQKTDATAVPTPTATTTQVKDEVATTPLETKHSDAVSDEEPASSSAEVSSDAPEVQANDTAEVATDTTADTSVENTANVATDAIADNSDASDTAVENTADVATDATEESTQTTETEDAPTSSTPDTSVENASDATADTSDVATDATVDTSAENTTDDTAVADTNSETTTENANVSTDDSQTPDYSNVDTAVSGQLGAGTLTSAQRSAIVNEALSLSQQGIPYVWGGKTTAGFDCSGLASYVFAQAGASLPSYTVSEESYVNTLDVSTPADVTANAQPGDLLFWGGHGASWHVAIYIGNGQYVAAPQPGMNVEVETVSSYFMPSFIGRY
jgi:Cell wall-associated hydrolases (invasion-associated proteins)